MLDYVNDCVDDIMMMMLCSLQSLIHSTELEEDGNLENKIRL